MKRKQKTQTQSFAQIKKNENKNNVQIVQIDFQNSCTFTYKLIKKENNSVNTAQQPAKKNTYD